MRITKRILVILFICLVAISIFSNYVEAGVSSTVHNLSTSGPGSIKSDTEDRICVFCHTPHNSNPATAIWNHETSSASYTLYDSESMDATDMGQPAGTSKLCLSCHDGTVAIGNLLTRTVSMTGTDAGKMPTTSNNHVGTDFSDDHPQDFTYDSTLANNDPLILDPSTNVSSLNGTIAETMLEDGNQMRCTSCHRPHDNSEGNFLIMDNTNHQLCVACHKKMQGDTKHKNCIWCHVEHNATESDHIRRGNEETLCLSCHDGQVHSVNGDTINGGAQITDIENQITKLTGHDVSSYSNDHFVTESNPPNTKHVECVDCHNVHESTGISHTLGTNAASGTLTKLEGVAATYDGTPWVAASTLTSIDEINYEYELCLRCHSSDQTGNGWWGTDDPAHTNIDKYINPNNAAHHAIVSPGEIGDGDDGIGGDDATYMNDTFVNGITVNSTIYCSDCHCNDDPTGPEGPHGAAHDYNVGDSTYTDSLGNSYICYDCHNVEVYGPGGTKGNLSRFAAEFNGYYGHTTEKHHDIGKIQFPSDQPKYTCFLCHGDYTAGGLHGTDVGNRETGFTTTDKENFRDGANIGDSPKHFLNGYGIRWEIDTGTGQRTCASYEDSNGVGCPQHIDGSAAGAGGGGGGGGGNTGIMTYTPAW